MQFKSARVSALTGSVPRKMAEGWQRVSEPCENRTLVARLTATVRLALTLSHEFMSIYRKKRYITRSVEYQGQARNTRILELKQTGPARCQCVMSMQCWTSIKLI